MLRLATFTSMGLFNGLFKKKEPILPPADLGGNLVTDVHSHFLPGIDDGAPDMETSIALITAMRDLGYSKLVTTPHCMSDYYKNSPEIITAKRDEVRAELKARNIDIQLEAAAEYYLDEDLERKVKAGEVLTFGDNYLLFELPFIDEPGNINHVIFAMQTAGYKPVLAHIERYTFWHRNWDKFEEIVERGVRIQINLGSLTGAYGPDVRKIAERLIDAKMVHLLGSDCHHMQHIDLLHNVRRKQYLHKALELELINRSL